MSANYAELLGDQEDAELLQMILEEEEEEEEETDLKLTALARCSVNLAAAE